MHGAVTRRGQGALSNNLSASANGSDGSVNAKLMAATASAEAVTELAGRSTALMGLRDGLFRACEAYANGAIGQDLYALIISHYGQLMTTLFLAQDTGGPLTRPGIGTASPQVPQNAPAAGDAAHTADVERPGQRLPIIKAALSDTTPLLLQPITDAAAKDALMANGSQSAPGTGSDKIALVLARMNEDFIDLSGSHSNITACINNGDPSLRLQSAIGPDGVKRPLSNWLLDQECQRLLEEIVLEESRRTTSIRRIDPR